MTAWGSGSTVQVRAEGKIDANGYLVIGCNKFTRRDLDEFALSYEVTPPPSKPLWLPGDLAKDVTGALFFRTSAAWVRAVGTGPALVEPLTLVYRDRPSLEPGDKVRVAPGAQYRLNGKDKPALATARDVEWVVMERTFWDTDNIGVSKRGSSFGYSVLPEYLTKVPQVGDRVKILPDAKYDGTFTPGRHPVNAGIYTIPAEDSILESTEGPGGNWTVGIYLVAPEFVVPA